MADDDPETEERPAAPGADGFAAGMTPFFYANSASVVGGAFDVAIDFGYQNIGTPSGEPVTTWQARVAMSWEHARSLHTLLGKQLKAYEDAVGNFPDIDSVRGGD